MNKSQITQIFRNLFYVLIKIFYGGNYSIFLLHQVESSKIPLEGDLGGFHTHPYPFAVACKLWRIHTLYCSNAIAEIAGMCNKHGVFKNISAAT